MTMRAAQTAQYRLAAHYNQRLQRASAAIRHGPSNREYWLRLIQQDWEQIRSQQANSASRQSKDSEWARLCATFAANTADVIRVRLSPADQLLWAQQALIGARKIQDGEAELNLLYQLSFLGLTLETPALAEDYADQLIACAESANDALGLGRAGFILGAVAFIRGRYDRAEAAFRECIKQLRRCGAINEMGQGWLGLGRVYNLRGDYEQARAYYQEYLNTALATGHEQAELEARMSLAGVHLAMQDLDTAEVYAQESLAMARALGGISRYLPPALQGLAHIEKAQMQLDKAVSHYEEAIEIARLMSAPSVVSNGLHGLAQTRALQGDYAAAMIHLEDGLKVASDGHILLRVCEIAHDLVIVQVKAGEMTAARHSLQDALDSAHQLGTPYFMAKALASAVCLWQARGDHEQAAIWAGLLQNDLSLLPPTLFDEVVYEQLEDQLGTTVFRLALDQGKALTLDAAISQVQRLL